MSIPIRGTSHGSPGAAYETAKRRGAQRLDFLLPYLTALYADAATVGIRADVLVAQWDLETGAGTSVAWLTTGNPAGLGIFDDGTTQGLSFAPEAAARAQTVHMLAYLGIEPPEDWKRFDVRWQAVVDAGYVGTVTTTADLGNGRWATDPHYGSKLEARHAAYAFAPPASPAPIPSPSPTEDDTVSTITWPGLPGGPITFSFPFSTRYMVSANLTLNRPGIKARRPRLPVQHENGNPDAYAAQDSSYLAGGAGGRQASWHGTVDHMEGFANLPADEVGWHAGDGAGPGNYQGFAVELSQRSLKQGGTVARTAISHAAEVMGRVMARLDGSTDWGQHARYMVKNCPEYMRGNATWWGWYKADATAFYKDEKARMAGSTPAPADDVIHIGDTIKAIVVLNLRQAASTSAPVLRTLAIDEQMVVNGPYVVATGYGWLPVRAGALNGFVAIGDSSGRYVEKVSVAPAPPPVTYAAKMPIPGLLLTDLQKHDTAQGISTVNEHDFVFVADVIEFTEETVAAQHGGKGAPAVKASYRQGTRAIAAWLVETVDNGWHYVLAGGDDEWVRVPYVNTIRVSDAPLLGDAMH